MNTHDKYVNQYKELINKDANYARGWELDKLNSCQIICDLIEKTKSETLLDYGCGQGKQYTEDKVHEKYNFLMPTLYDPAVELYSSLPNEIFDGIISTDVLEHIPEDVLPSTFEYMFNHATKFLYLKIATNKACTILPNGENAHTTIKPYKWWSSTIKKYNTNNILVYLHESKGTNQQGLI